MSELSDWKRIILPSELAAARAEGKAEGIAEVNEALSAAQQKIAELEAERAEAHAIVSRVWKALGISKYADAQGKAIDEIVADLLESHKRQLRERREEELREDGRLGKMMARAETAEQALTAERQRRESAEAALREISADAYTAPGILPDYRAVLSALNERINRARAHFTRYPTASDLEERGG